MMNYSEKELHSYETCVDFGAQPEVLEIQIGNLLAPLVEKDKPVVKVLNDVRNEIDSKFGLPLPDIRVVENTDLKPTEYAIFLNGTKIAGFKGLTCNQILCVDSGDVKEKITDNCIVTKEPAFGLSAFIIDKSRLEEAKTKGYSCSNLEKVIKVHLTQIIKSNLTLFLNQCMVNTLVNKVRPSNPDVIDSLFFENEFSTSRMKKVLNILLEEKISIRDMNTILETIADNIEKDKSPVFLAERVREKLAYQFFSEYVTENNTIEAIKFDHGFTKSILESSTFDENDPEHPFINLAPDKRKELFLKISENLLEVVNDNKQPFFICESDIRRSLFVTISRNIPEVIIISDKEFLSCKDLYSLKIAGEIHV